MRFPRRLTTIANHIPGGRTVVDVGTGHCLLPVYLISQSGSTSPEKSTPPAGVPRVIAVESKRGPFEASRIVIENASRKYPELACRLNKDIDLRFGDGLDPVEIEECEVLVMAGIGGEGIVNILKKDPAKAESFHTLIFQPSSRAWYVRRWLLLNGFCIIREDLVLEGGRFFEIIVACKEKSQKSLGTRGLILGYEEVLSPVQMAREQLKGATPEGFVAGILWEAGPLLWLHRHPLLGAFLNDSARRYDSVGSASGIRLFSEKATCLRAIIDRLDEQDVGGDLRRERSN
jgi:tRNA A22 N-methylase